MLTSSKIDYFFPEKFSNIYIVSMSSNVTRNIICKGLLLNCIVIETIRKITLDTAAISVKVGIKEQEILFMFETRAVGTYALGNSVINETS